jgi:PAS domain-containing protein
LAQPQKHVGVEQVVTAAVGERLPNQRRLARLSRPEQKQRFFGDKPLEINKPGNGMHDNRRQCRHLSFHLAQRASSVWKLIEWRATGLCPNRMPPTAPTPSEAEQILALVDVLPDVFLFVKDRASRFVRANRAFLVMHGCRSNADVVGRTDHDFHPPALATQYAATGCS